MTNYISMAVTLFGNLIRDSFPYLETETRQLLEGFPLSQASVSVNILVKILVQHPII